ncbi:hypothetical protein [Nocardiopsis sp. FIRDI 009]|uniref:hypothetical protein n=1 Tax=Nocardiopsis sp. FIRDI 009 TaxID=714197 RepID=UPI001300AE19|nr:hypothetical protein [Nocardiopsis sp. FIRDI 009]
MSEFENFCNWAKEIMWDSSADSRKSQVRLFQEYLRRAALWASEYRESGWPFYDIAESVDPSFRAPEAKVRDVVNSLPEGGTYYTFKTIEWSLHFAALLDRGDEMPEFANPFEPLLLIYRRGSVVNLSPSGSIEVGEYSIPRKTPEKCRILKPLSDLSEESLSSFDE